MNNLEKLLERLEKVEEEKNKIGLINSGVDYDRKN